MTTGLDPESRQQLRRAFLRDAAAPGGCLAAVSVGLALVPVRSVVPRPVVLVMLVLVTAVAAALGGWVAGVVTAVGAAFIVDFAHTEPYTLLTLPTLLRPLGVLLLVGLLAGARASAVDRQRCRSTGAVTGARRAPSAARWWCATRRAGRCGTGR